MIVTAALQRCNTAITSCTTLATDTKAFDEPLSIWFATVDYDFGTVNTTFTAAEPMLVLKVIVPIASRDWAWFAYDTSLYPARLDVTGS